MFAVALDAKKFNDGKRYAYDAYSTHMTRTRVDNGNMVECGMPTTIIDTTTTIIRNA